MGASTTEEEQTKQASQVPVTEQGEEEYPHLTEEEAEDIFRKALAEIPPHLLVRQKTPQEKAAEVHLIGLVLVAFLSMIAGAVVGIITYPTVTVTITPISKSVTYTARLLIATRTLAPVTVSKAETIPTTGEGHQPATQAEGILTFYNGLFTSQEIPAGTVFIGQDGMKVTTNEAVTIPAANLPQVGVATVSATSSHSGKTGNIPSGDINITITNGVLVKNLTPFTGGRDARTYQAVAQKDLDTLTSILEATLTQQIPQAFRLHPGESVVPTNCVFSGIATKRIGDEAATVTVKAHDTCQGIAYDSNLLQQQTATAFTNQTRPGTTYELVNMTQPQVVSSEPFTVQVSGTWVYVLSQDYKQYLAQQIAGDSPQQARSYLLHTGLITRASIPRNLPKDPQHIKFLVLIGS